MAAIIKQYPTFVVDTLGIAPGNDKSMLSLVNAVGSSIILKLHEIWIRNIQTAAVTGVMTTFSLRRITDHSGGIDQNIFSHDTNDILSSSITAKEDAIVSGEANASLWRWIMSSDEWGPGTLDLEGFAGTISNHFPVWRRIDDHTKPIILRAGQGIHIRCNTNTTVGNYDMYFVFTQENV